MAISITSASLRERDGCGEHENSLLLWGRGVRGRPSPRPFQTQTLGEIDSLLEIALASRASRADMVSRLCVGVAPHRLSRPAFRQASLKAVKKARRISAERSELRQQPLGRCESVNENLTLGVK